MLDIASMKRVLDMNRPWQLGWAGALRWCGRRTASLICSSFSPVSRDDKPITLVVSGDGNWFADDMLLEEIH